MVPTPTMQRSRLLPVLLAAAAVAAGCGSAPPDGSAEHRHRTTTTLTVTDDAILPSARVVIPTFSSVVWRNRASVPLEVTIDATTCGRCDTVLGFTPSPNGARCTAIAPGSVASICFHADGTFPFKTRLGGSERTGEIVVGGGAR
jgi:hypothetical protein